MAVVALGGAAAMYEIGATLIVAVSALYTAATGIEAAKNTAGLFLETNDLGPSMLHLSVNADVIAKIIKITLNAGEEFAKTNTTIFAKREFIDLCGNVFLFTNQRLLSAQANTNQILNSRLEQCGVVFDQFMTAPRLQTIQGLLNYVPLYPNLDFVKHLPPEHIEWANIFYSEAARPNKNGLSFGTSAFLNFQSKAYYQSPNPYSITDPFLILKIATLIIILIPLILYSIPYIVPAVKSLVNSIRYGTFYVTFLKRYFDAFKLRLFPKLKEFVHQTQLVAENGDVETAMKEIAKDKKHLRSTTRKRSLSRKRRHISALSSSSSSLPKWDYSRRVLIEDDEGNAKQSLTIHWNRGDDISVVVNNFLKMHKLSLDNFQNVYNFVVKST
jgi:hypothetical protein